MFSLENLATIVITVGLIYGLDMLNKLNYKTELYKKPVMIVTAAWLLLSLVEMISKFSLLEIGIIIFISTSIMYILVNIKEVTNEQRPKNRER